MTEEELYKTMMKLPEAERPVNLQKPKPKFKRIANQSAYSPPEGAKSQGFGYLESVVPVSAVARDWGISARRIRMMLVEGRLNGRQLENGYWEVFYPYSYTFGKRGPTLKRQQKGVEELAKKPKRLRGEDAEIAREFYQDGRKRKNRDEEEWE